MKHTNPKRRDVYEMHARALSEGWHSVNTVPLRGEGEFFVLTFSGLIRRARMHSRNPRIRPADGRGPERISVVAVESGNYLTAIAWKWTDPVEE